MLANGFWQAEGYIGGFFRSGLNFYPLCTATQLLSEQSVEFFLKLNKYLSNKGSFSITLNNQNKFIIQYKLSGWDTFFSIFVPYFYMLYGTKYQAVHKLKKIYELINEIKVNPDKMKKVMLISIVYSLTAHSSRYILTIEEKLISLKLNPILLKNVTCLDKLNILENKILPSLLFILGFFLGDGTLYLKLEWKEKNSTIVIIPLFNIVQSNIESNKFILNLMIDCLNNMGIKTSLERSTKVISLTVKGIDNVFNSLLPYLEKYSHFLYWKNSNYKFLMWSKGLIMSGGHHTYFGLKAIIDKIYNNVNKRSTDKDIWTNRLNIWLDAVKTRRDWGEFYIYAIYTSNKEIRGWQVRFPSTFKKAKSNKAFISSTCGGQNEAFVLAVQYRDKILSDWINTFK